jgi:serine/threonine-protein phosphatase 4 regulatory subunit 4
MCRHLALIARGVGHEATKAMIMPQLVELSNDEVSDVRLAAIETVVNLLSVLDDDICTQTIVPLVIKSCDQAKQLEDETLPRLAHHLGRLCHGLMPNLNADHKVWFINFYKHLSGIGVDGKKAPPASETGQMPDLVPPIQDKSEIFSDSRRECAYNFPAMVIFVGPSSFVESLYSTFAGLAADPVAKVRKTLASSLHELAKLVGTSFNTTKVQIVRLFHDDSVDVLDAMITNMVHVIDALARFGVLQFGQGGQFSADLSAALLHCEATVDRTRNWRLQADCLEKFSCLANCISPVTIQTRFIPLLFDRMKNTRTLPCKIAAARTLLVILRFTVKSDDRTHIHFRIQEELAGANSCHIRMLYLRLCEMAMALFSKEYFKQQFFGDLISLSVDLVANVRLKLCTMMPRLKSLLSLPSDKVI